MPRPPYLSFLFALRYYRNHNSVQLIRLLSRVSVISVSACIAALIIILSVFNGFHTLIESLYKHFYTDLRIQARNSRYFELSASQKQALENIPQISQFGRALKSKGLLQTEEGQISAELYGIDSNFFQLIDLKKHLYQPRELSLQTQEVILGQGLANSIQLDRQHNLLNIYFPKRNIGQLDLESNLSLGRFQMINQFATGQGDFDNQLAWLPLTTLQRYLGLDSNKISQISLNLHDSQQSEAVIAELRRFFPAQDFEIATYYAQNQQLYSVINGEKNAIILILAFIMLLASFNITGTLSVALLHKRKHLFLLFGMGMSRSTLQRIFLYQGLLLGIVGCFWGLLCGSLLLLSQYFWHWIPMQGRNLLINYFPVRFQFGDYLMVSILGLGIVFLASLYAMYRVRIILKGENTLRLR